MSNYNSITDPTSNNYSTNTLGAVNSIQTLRTNLESKNEYISYLTLNTALNEPNLTTRDVMNRDSQNMIVQQNTLYIIGTITASTCLILAIMFGYDD